MPKPAKTNDGEVKQQSLFCLQGHAVPNEREEPEKLDESEIMSRSRAPHIQRRYNENQKQAFE